MTRKRDTSSVVDRLILKCVFTFFLRSHCSFTATRHLIFSHATVTAIATAVCRKQKKVYAAAVSERKKGFVAVDII